MENVTTRSTQGNWGLLEPVHPGSVTFNESILAPLRDNYLYEESKECFTYNSAHLINNDALQKRYAAFRSEKREKGYSEQELEESFGFLLLDDANRARKVGETGLLVGKAKCTTLGDPLKGFYISKYSDCLDLKRWYDGKTGYIVLLKLTKGRVKDVTDNYTQNFTPPTPGFDCHVSDQLGAVSSTTSSFLAYERTQYYMYELRDGSSKAESCPRHACPFAIVAFSYGKMSTTSELEQKSQDKTVFHYQPWIGQFKIESTVYDVGLQSASGAWFPAKLPKTVQIDHAIGVSELKRTLPREIFETCIVGEVCIDGRCFNLYDVVSSKAKNDLAQIAHELKEKDMALVIPLEDSGFLILLHSSHLFSYEDAKSGKAAALQGMFIFPDSRTVPRDAKSDLTNTKVSSEIMQVIPALNYAETEMGKCPPNQQGCSKSSLEKCLQEYGTLFHPGLLDVPTREASMFPDQFDVPGGFTLISPKWSQETGTRLKSYFDEPCGFTIPVVRALELLTTGRQQRGDDHDDDVYYCISSPEEVPQTDAPVESETSHRTVEKVEKQKDANKHLSTEQPQPALPDGLGKLGTAVVTVADSVLEDPTSTVSPKLGDVPTENCVSIDTDVDKTSQGSTKGDADEVCVDLSTKETHVHTSSTPLITSTEEVGTAGRMEDNIHPEKTMADHAKKVNRRSFSRRKGRKRKIHWRTMKIKKGVKKKVDLPSSSLPLVLPVNSTDDPTKEQTPSETMHADDINQRPHSTRRGKGRRQRRVNRNLSEAKQTQEPLSVSTETILDQSIKNETSPSKRDWRSLPRRKRLWNTDANLKRSLRSAAAKIEETIVNAQADTTKQSLSSAPKRKMEGFSLRERYGLKTIITTCGRVFVPHGSDVDVQSANKRQSEKMHVEMNMDTNAETVSPVENKSTEIVESKGESPSMVMEELPCKNPVVIDGEDMAHSPSSEMPSALLSALNILRKLNKNNPLETDKSKDLCSEKSMNATSNENVGLQQTNKDHPVTVQTDATSSPPRESDQSMLSDPKVSSPDKIKKKTKHSVYSAISISKLKTVLRRGKRAKSPSPGNSAKSEPDKAEPESKIRKLDTVVDLKCDIIKNELKDKGSQPMNDKEQHAPMKPVEITKQPVSWRGLIHKATKENGSLNFDTSAPFEIAKHTDQQLISSLGDRVGRRRISVDGKASAESVSMGASLPSDALSLLADLALGSSNDKVLSNLEAKPGQEASGSPQSVLHALLRCPSTRFKLPPRSPFPEGLLVTGELILEISKEHSYSQPTSLLSGLSGPPPQVSSPSGCVDSPLSLKTGLHLNLPKDGAASCHQEEGGKTEWKHLISADKPMSFIPKTKARKSRFLRNRRIIEKEGKIQVMRIWEEDYDFKFDSKFTNDSIDKTVTRALHGKWNFSIEDTFEDVHIIFHMWIGLFYSKHTSRLFHLENSTALPKGKDVEKVHLDINAIQNAVSLLNVELSSKEDSSRSVPLSTEVLDLSVKNGEPVNLCSVSNQSRIKDTASHPGGISPTCKHEKAPSHSPSGRSLSLNPKVTTMMSYRSTVDLPVENSVPDSDTETDDENDITTDCSYSQLLERNSAYNQLCEQASNMRIGIRLLLPKVRNVTNTEASTRVSTVDLKKIGVFHQVLSPVKPSAFSKPHRLILGRKSFALSLKNETGHVEHAVLQKENVSVNAESKEISKTNRSKDECPEAVVDGNVDDTRHRASISVQEKSVSVSEESKEVSDEDSQDGCLTIMEDGNVEEIMTSKSPSQDQISIAEHKCSAHAKEDLKLLEDLKGHANKVDDLRDASLLETNVEEHNETSNAKKEHQPLLDDTNLVDHADVLSDISSDGTRVEEYNETSNAKEDLKPVHDHLKDQPKMVDELRDATSDGTSVEEHIETSHAKKELKPLLDDTNLVDHFDKLSDTSSDETRVVENETSNAKDLKPVHDLKEHTADELRGATSDETKVEKCKEISSAKEEHDPKDQLNLIDASSHAIEGNDTKEPVEEDEGYTGEELMQEGESKSKEWDNLDGRDTEHETSIVMVERLDEIVLGLKDDINSVDMEFSDDDDDDDDVQTQKSETQPQTPEETYLEDYALELSSDSCSADDEPMSVQEKHTPDSDIDSLEGMQDEIETKTLQQSLVVQQEALEVCQNELKPASTVEPTKLDISKSEKDDERDLGQQDTSKVSAEVDTIVDEETKSQGSCEDEVIKTYQECALPPNILTDSRNEMVAPHALTVDKPSEVEVNSMCSTPTQDEMACFSEVHEHLYFPDNTVCVDKLPPKISVTPHTHVSTTKPFSDFIGHNEETHNDELRWKYPGTMDFKDESALTIKCSPSEDPFQLRQNKLCPTSQQKDDENSNFIEGATQNDSELFYREDNVDDLPGYYQGSDEGLPWTDYQIEEPVDHQLYPCEIEFSGDNDQPICSKYITSERKYSYRHKKRARKEFDNYCWEEKKYKLDPLSVTFTAEYTREQSPKKKSRKSKFTVSRQNSAWDEEGIVDYSIQKTCSKPTREVTVSSLPHVKTSKQQFDWSRYFRREAASSQLLDVSERDDKFDIPPSSIVTILDRKGNRVTFSNSPTMKPSFIGLENSLNDWQEQQSMADVTRSAVDLEYLIFSKKMNQVLKENKKVRAQSSSSTTSHCWSNPNQATCPMTIQFSNLGEVENSVELSKAQSSITDFKIKVDMSDKREMEPVRNRKPHLQRLFCEKGNEVEFAGISEITKQCAVTYKSMMNDVCSRKTLPRPVEASGKGIKRKYNRESVGQHPGFCGRIKKDTFNNPHDNIKSFVRQASKTKYRFFILVTSTDTFFEETKHLLEIEGHIPVEPNEFNLSDDCQSPLLIILRNEDIAEHICEVPCLLELKKSPNVLFAGIDRPDDVVNLAHQELFEKGGFIVCDELALDTLTLDDMKKVVGILEELDKQGKWKWFLHYRDSRRLRESARSSPEGSKKQQFIDFCQKAGIVEVLPYHECDVISRDRPDYLFCLTRLQIQNASVRFPVFITDTPTESFGTNGILTMNIYTFSRILSNDTCSVS
ncbi:protein TASOR 2 isoform X1 [Chanodichthys erythropterus]|uniref:protein TASOR 2 isoform X1 n=1 Tax=Chanodichthys erythropterus TaxID=933992 RepID=UPI00351E4319